MSWQRVESAFFLRHGEDKRRRSLPSSASTRACSSWKWNPSAAAPGGGGGGGSCLKGSVERSLLPWAIFLSFTRNRPWKSEDHLCTLFLIEMSKERLEKSERTPPVSWRPWALAYSRDRPYNFSCLSTVSKNRRFRSFFSALGSHLAKKSL